MEQRLAPGFEIHTTASLDLNIALVMDSTVQTEPLRLVVADQIPSLYRALSSGDVDADGVQDQPTPATMDFAVLTPDMGWESEGSTATGCTGRGEDGAPQTVSGCSSEPNGRVLLDLEGGDDPEAASGSIACILRGMRTTSCPIAQHTYAIYSNGRFWPEIRAREGQLFVYLVMSAMDDCSPPGPSPPLTAFGTVSRLRCVQERAFIPNHWLDAAVHGYVFAGDDFRLLAIGGLPAELVDASPNRWDPILRDDRLQPSEDPEAPGEVAPLCVGPGGTSIEPAPNLAQAVRSRYGSPRDLGSLCRPDLAEEARHVASRIGGILSQSCLPPSLPEDLERCDLVEISGGCHLAEGRSAMAPAERRGIPICAVDRSLWRVDTDSALTERLCGHLPPPRRVVLDTERAGPDSELRLECPRITCDADADCEDLEWADPEFFACDPETKTCVASCVGGCWAGEFDCNENRVCVAP